MALPDTLQAGQTVVYHLEDRLRNAAIENPHRVAVVNQVYAVTNVAKCDLEVRFQSGDDGYSSRRSILIKDVAYDEDCPEGTFCLLDDGDDLPTAADVVE